MKRRALTNKEQETALAKLLDKGSYRKTGISHGTLYGVKKRNRRVFWRLLACHELRLDEKSPITLATMEPRARNRGIPGALALLVIHEEHLYTSRGKSFADYCHDIQGFGEDAGFRKLALAKMYADLWSRGRNNKRMIKALQSLKDGHVRLLLRVKSPMARYTVVRRIVASGKSLTAVRIAAKIRRSNPAAHPRRPSLQERYRAALTATRAQIRKALSHVAAGKAKKILTEVNRQITTALAGTAVSKSSP